MEPSPQRPPVADTGRPDLLEREPDLLAFLLARIADDVRSVRADLGDGHTDPRPHGRGGISSRLLAECDAKWRIVDDHWHLPSTTDDGRLHYMDCEVCVEAGGYARRGGWCLTLRALALPYASHPEYRRQWRP